MVQIASPRLARAVKAAALIVLVAAGARSAAARDPEDVFSGQIITATKAIPTQARSKSAYVSTLRKMKTGKFFEDKAKKQWKVYYTAFFRRPLNDLEVTVKIFDVSSGQHLINSYEQYLDKRGTRSFTSHVTIDRDSFGVNKNLLMVMENRGTVLASARFAILGEGEHYSGQVNFSEEDTKGSDQK